MKVVTFGEIMLRLAPPGFQRFTQARSFEASYGGGEANVAVSLANYGEAVEFVTRLPKNELGEACLSTLRGCGVGTHSIVRGGDRIGIYFLEAGAAQRASKVIYDRAGSSFAAIEPGMVDWKSAFAGADWFHWTGITPAVSRGAAEACREAIGVARELGLTVSCDLNYRAKLWKWGRPAGEVMAELVGLCQVALGNEEDADKVFGIRAEGTSVSDGHVESAGYADVAEQLARRFPRLRVVAFTQRGSISASENTWSGVLWTPDTFVVARTWRIAPIVDRVGAGDAFAAGLITALADGLSPADAIEFAVAAGCLKHSLRGDVNLVSRAEVEALAGGSGAGRVER